MTWTSYEYLPQHIIKKLLYNIWSSLKIMTLALMLIDQLKDDVKTISIIITTTKTVTLLAGVTIDTRQEQWEVLFCTSFGSPFILSEIYEI